MSSMFKKKGGMGIKPKMPMAHPRAPGAASSQPPRAPSSTAIEPASQAESTTIADEATPQSAVDVNAGVDEGATESTDTPPSTKTQTATTATLNPQPASQTTSVTASQPAGTGIEAASAPPIDELPTQQPTPVAASVTPSITAPQSTPTTSGTSNSRPTETSTPAQLQTPPATNPSENVAIQSTETEADNQAGPVATTKATRAPAKRVPKKRTAPPADTETEDAGEGTSAAPKPKRQRKRKDDAAADGEAAPKRQARPRKKKTPEEGATEETEDCTAGNKPKRFPRKARSETPEDAEEKEADLSVLTMGDLTRDLRIGKKFSRHDELLQRHREKQAKARDRLKAKRNGSEDIASESGTPVPVPVPKARVTSMPSTGPQFQIIDGQIVVDQNSLALDRHAIADAEADDMLEIEENDFTTLTTQNSYRTGSKLKGPNVWTEDETELFYRGLRMFGTDFQMISGMFPGKNRRHVKMKFNREERHNPARVDSILVGEKQLQIDLEEYKTWTKAEYEPVEDIMAAQRAQEAEFNAKQAKAKAEKDAINAKKLASLQDPEERAAAERALAEGGSGSGGGEGGGSKVKSRPQANIGPQITVDADGMITIDETNMDPDAGKRKRGTGKAKKKAVEYNMRGEIIR
ncbi:Transcription factor TFIIIB component B'' [Colletotrichum sidae]|uniref:Transcription factor TFIIIB component B n=1 Tax=Colletotrichum sidae TaxID=1347389 RepID=A0A4R8TTK2_9PEZI|nr:Transcription factor TFIIIB component B'' [Colletotrichum sidae]